MSPVRDSAMDKRTTVYIDVEDDITAIINKLKEAPKKQVALVVPKRSSVLQSAVNMKLIKKGAHEAAKEPTLITEDQAINKLAAKLGLLTAPNLKTEPKVPAVSETGPASLPSDTIEGEAVGTAPKSVTTEDTEATYPLPGKTKAAAAKKATTPAGKTKRVPDFNRFKKRFLLVGLGVLGLGLAVWAALFWLPRAKVIVEGQTESLAADFTFTVDTEAKQADLDNDLLPGKRRDLAKTLSSNFKPTGKKDVGTKATGTLTIKNCEDTNARALSAGSRFTSSNGKVFLSNAAATVPAGSFSGGGAVCNSSTVDVGVSALENGDSYNIGATTYTSSALAGNFIISGTGMSGGSSKTITVVTQGDIDSTKTDLLNNERAGAKRELANQFDEDEYMIEASMAENVEQVTSDPAVDQEASSARLSVKVTYTALGVDQDQLKELMKKNEEELAKKANKSLGIINEGLDDAEITAKDKPSPTAQRFQVKTEATLGPKIDTNELKDRLAGKNYSDSVQIVKSYPNVTNADVKFSPFWVKRVPRDPNKVTIEIKIPQR
ncbi:hypothetical protein HY441_00310 [Candidatus Microgenomates bacterium]|nr:hypothetical protein [Candidatus Microgenomates bacterium]